MVTVHDFFAGSGLVTVGLNDHASVVWANDIDPKKAATYIANHGDSHFHLGSIENVRGAELPSADISWASFPCQDLSLAGQMKGIRGGRSGMFWEWLRVLDEQPNPPSVLCLENVLGLVSADGGKNYQALHLALRDRGFKVGAMMIDAVNWLPQSRKRIFVVACPESANTEALETDGPNWLHPRAVQNAMLGLKGGIWWRMPKPAGIHLGLDSLVDFDALCFEAERADQLLSLLPDKHRETIESYIELGIDGVFPGYRRTRNGKQVLECRFDNCSGCLRTAEGGSSRQFLIILRDGKLSARLLTTREAARLMGAADEYQLPENYNEAYNAMGDAVAVPVVDFLARHLLVPLTDVSHDAHRRTPEFRLQA